MGSSIRAAGIDLNRDACAAYFQGSRLAFTPRELRLVEVFLEQPDRVLPRSELHRRVWGTVGTTARVVDTYVSRVRTKLRAAGHPGISVIRQRGYLILSP